jgi:hypothetical protein
MQKPNLLPFEYLISFFQFALGKNIPISAVYSENEEGSISRSEITVAISDTKKVAELKKFHDALSVSQKIFPTVFSPADATSPLYFNTLSKLKLRIFKVPFLCSYQNKLTFPSFSLLPLSFHIQFIKYILDLDGELYPIDTKRNFTSIHELYRFLEENYKGKQQHAYLTISDLPKSSSASWLQNQLQVDYTHGQLIDYIDQLYDEYKHTNISPSAFHVIFKTFGNDCVKIANDAFDIYMETRNTYEAWTTSIQNYLHEKYQLSISYALQIGKQLMLII